MLKAAKLNVPSSDRDLLGKRGILLLGLAQLSSRTGLYDMMRAEVDSIK
jgi:hypothetical protein